MLQKIQSLYMYIYQTNINALRIFSMTYFEQDFYTYLLKDFKKM